jgi:hypothetical protein
VTRASTATGNVLDVEIVRPVAHVRFRDHRHRLHPSRDRDVDAAEMTRVGDFERGDKKLHDRFLPSAA